MKPSESGEDPLAVINAFCAAVDKYVNGYSRRTRLAQMNQVARWCGFPDMLAWRRTVRCSFFDLTEMAGAVSDEVLRTATAHMLRTQIPTTP